MDRLSAVKRVRAEFSQEESGFITVLQFLDKDDKPVGSYNPKIEEKATLSSFVQLDEGEELIGVYGVHDKQDWITSLGLIVRSVQTTKV